MYINNRRLKLVQIFFVEAAREVLRRVGFGSQKELLHGLDKEFGVTVFVLGGSR